MIMVPERGGWLLKGDTALSMIGGGLLLVLFEDQCCLLFSPVFKL
jgi:hypothetical protein